ncbi:radical SAM protein [Pendulispora albinea]|uniref:Radical SAM protein n=1 Tax=Pendulispora albinea TaxID=2741071 RepID=A0ABZ2LZ48_9BACT
MLSNGDISIFDHDVDTPAQRRTRVGLLPVSAERIADAQRRLNEVGAVQPKKIDFQNPFFTQPRDTKICAVENLLGELSGTKVRHIYLHVPYCMTRCIYCHYPIVRPGTEKADEHSAFVETLVREIRAWSRSGLDFGGLQTIALGGGTPNALSHQHLETILQTLAECFPTRREVSIEVLPSFRILDEDKYRIFQAAGVNRLSVGIQSFNDLVNEANRRTYQREDETRALIGLARTYFPNISVDLLYRQKAQEWSDLVRDVDEVKKLDVNSIYLYQVRESIGTKFSELQEALNYFLVELTKDGTYEAISFDQVIRKRNDDGMCQARSGRSQCEDLLGIGPSSVSELGDYTFRNVDTPMYLQPSSSTRVDETTIIRREQEWRQCEWISRGLRHFNLPRLDGVSFAMFEERFGERPSEAIVGRLQFLESIGLLELGKAHATLTDLGMLFTQAISGYLIGHYK